MYYELKRPIRKEWQNDKEETVLLLLGACSDLRKVADAMFLNAAVNYFRVLCPEHRNLARTTIKDEPCTMEDYADDAAALIQSIIPNSAPVHVIGYSFGGMIAQHLAIKYPHLVKKLVLCCTTPGGDGGLSFNLPKWYQPGTSVEERVEKRMMQADTDKTPEYKKWNPVEWKMLIDFQAQDEKIGEDEPLREEGRNRHFMCIKHTHNAWDRLGELEMPVLVLASPKDNVAPPRFSMSMVEKIGDNAEGRYDFDCGHTFLASDPTAMPFINDWLRKSSHEKHESTPSEQMFEVIGGGNANGLLVRSSCELESEELADRLAVGSIVQGLRKKGHRLQYKLVEGDGPSHGWISTKLRETDLVRKVEGPNALMN